jgi:hypothetical protein
MSAKGRASGLWRLVTPRRIIISSLFAMVVVLGLYLWLVLCYDDIMPQDKDYPPSVVENEFSWVCVLALWPAWIVEILLGHDPVTRIYWPLIWIVTGSFWGFVVELLFVWRKRNKPNIKLESAASGHGSALGL